MITAALFAIVGGAIVLALVVDLVAFAGWVRRQLW
jgi:hypothetical protein